MNTITFFMRLRWLILLICAPLTLSAANTLTVVPSTTNYLAAGGSVTFTVTLTYTDPMAGLGLDLNAPSGWRFVSAGGVNVPQLIPTVSDLGPFNFNYQSIPASPASFTFTLSYPAGRTTNQVFSGIVATFANEAGATASVPTGNITLTPPPSGPSVVVAKASGQADPTTVTPINFSVVFSEAVTGFDAADVVLSGTAGAVTKTISGSGASYTVAVGGMTGSGTVVVTIPAGAAQNGTGAGNLASTGSDNSVTYNVPSALTVTPVSVSLPAAGGTFSFNVETSPAATPSVTSNAAWLPVPAVAAVLQTQWTLSVTVGANAGAERVGVLTVGANGLTRQVTVTQAAAVAPAAPVAVAATDNLADKVTVTWAAVTGVTGYDVYRAATNDSASAVKLTASPVTATTFDDTTAVMGTGYFYWVKSRNGTLESGFSASDAGLRPNVVAPVIVTSPVSRAVRLAGTTTFAVTATGTAPLTYQWKKNGTALANDARISGATTATLTLTGATLADAGSYTVTVSNTQGSPTSAAAALAVVDAQHSVAGGTYRPGSTVAVNVMLAFAGPPVALALDALLPEGWSYAGGTGEPDVKPVAGTTAVIGWAWNVVPTSPVTFTYSLNVPAAETGEKSVRGRLVFRQDAGPTDILMLPDPLVLTRAPLNHSADYHGGAPDSKINVDELTRVIQLYNVRNGTVRTGAYKVATGAATEDGYDVDPARAPGVAATITPFHSADTARGSTPRNGAIDLVELTRVIELFNYRSGTTRTGEYHVKAGTEDGFAPGPAPVSP